jgi:hypothetical protein
MFMELLNSLLESLDFFGSHSDEYGEYCVLGFDAV